jgi:hypothetical protein
MQGYEVRTIDDDKIGHVVDVDGDFLIVEHGLLKSKHALPKTFTEVDADNKVVRTTLSKDVINHSPKVNGELDRQAVLEHYGLAEGLTDPPTRGLDELEPDLNAYGADDSLREEIETRKEVAAGEGPFDERPYSPGVTGGDRRLDLPKDRRDYPTD